MTSGIILGGDEVELDALVASLNGRLVSTLSALRSAGAEIESSSAAGPPAQRALDRAELELARPIPMVLRQILSRQDAFRGSWHLPSSLQEVLPDATRSVVWGRIDLSIREVVSAEWTRQRIAEDSLPDQADPIGHVWRNKFAFHSVANGDYLAVQDGDGNDPVYYLSHEGDESHGIQLAPTLADFLDRWSQIGFAGPEDWLLLPFLDSKPDGINASGANAIAWREAVNLHLT